MQEYFIIRTNKAEDEGRIESMNREILFRGKRLDNGEWAYGVPLQYIGGQVGIVKCTEETRILPYDGDTEYHCVEELFSPKVDHATVGQYTGMTDNKNKRIFKGDIVDVRQGMDSGRATVSYEHGVFVVVPAYGDILERTLYDYWYNDWDIEVIGNIHDNPDLLDGKAEN